MSNIEKAQSNIKKLYKLINEPSFPIPKEMQAVHWAYIAVEFLTAASILDKKEPHFTNPKLQLTGHAIECSMKACIASIAAKPPVGKSPFQSLNPLELEVGQTYILSKQTPLMPSHSPADPIAALQQMKQIPKGGVFKVLETFKKRGLPWYKVVVLDQRKKRIGTGWINSAALLGQELKAHK